MFRSLFRKNRKMFLVCFYTSFDGFETLFLFRGIPLLAALHSSLSKIRTTSPKAPTPSPPIRIKATSRGCHQHSPSNHNPHSDSQSQRQGGALHGAPRPEQQTDAEPLRRAQCPVAKCPVATRRRSLRRATRSWARPSPRTAPCVISSPAWRRGRTASCRRAPSTS